MHALITYGLELDLYPKLDGFHQQFQAMSFKLWARSLKLSAWSLILLNSWSSIGEPFWVIPRLILLKLLDYQNSNILFSKPVTLVLFWEYSKENNRTNVSEFLSVNISKKIFKLGSFLYHKSKFKLFIWWRISMSKYGEAT